MEYSSELGGFNPEFLLVDGRPALFLRATRYLKAGVRLYVNNKVIPKKLNFLPNQGHKLVYATKTLD